jgi:hypothetical protein
MPIRIFNNFFLFDQHGVSIKVIKGFSGEENENVEEWLETVR